MIFLRLLLCSATSFGSSRAVQPGIPYDDVILNIFDSKVNNFETNIYDSLQTTQNFYAQRDIELAVDAGASVLAFVPFVGQLASLAPALRNILAEESEWRVLFAQTIAHEIQKEIAAGDVRWMEATIKTISDKIPLLSENNADFENRKTISSIIHTDFDKMVNFFGHTNSLFKKYPLIGTPPLIQLALLIATFSPLANTLIPLEAKNPQISCKMRDLLLEYRPYAVQARLAKVTSGSTLLADVVSTVRSLPYDEYGYNITNPGVVDCYKGCTRGFKLSPGECLKDAFSSEEYFVGNYMHLKCYKSYARLVRHRVEEIFPVKLLDLLCFGGKTPNTTGFGWLTIKLDSLCAAGGDDRSQCDTNGSCDPYVKIIINGEEVLKTPPRPDTFRYDADTTYTSKKISKTSTIKIEVWDDDSGMFGSSDDLILRTEGDVDSFLGQGLRIGAKVGDIVNSIDTISFWKDEYVDAGPTLNIKK